MSAAPATRSQIDPDVLHVADVGADVLARLLQRYELDLECVSDTAPIGGTYWGEPEAGIVGRRVIARSDTPVHSVLHEACHIVCMDPERRKTLDVDAGGDDLEEAAVCYLQLVLADRLAGVGRPRLMDDMDRWGYSFRLGSTRRWFHADAEDARAWLIGHGLLTEAGEPTFCLRP